VGFSLGEYDKSQTLIIDPIISYSTFLTGTAGGARGQDIAVDASGSVYLTGSTFLDYGFPGTEGALKLTDVEFPNRNYIFVAKLSSDGSNLLYSAVIGGTSGIPDPSVPGTSTYLDNMGAGIAIDSTGSAYVVGSTASRNFPTTPGAIVATYNPEPDPGEVTPKYAGFAMKLSASGGQLLYSTLLPDAFPTSIAVNKAGQATLAGFGREGF